MDLQKYFKEVLAKTDILKSPKRRLSTFGDTRIHYFFLSQVEGLKERSRLRKGLMVAEKPKIITPDFFRNRFEGFGEQADRFKEWLSRNYGDAFRGLEYKFRNETSYAQIENNGILPLAEQIEQRMTDFELNNSVILRGPDGAWQVALMKFIVDECMASFATNMKDLTQHGFFDSPEDLLKTRRKTIEGLLAQAKKDRTLLPKLQKLLQEFEMFAEYEDEFFRLVGR